MSPPESRVRESAPWNRSKLVGPKPPLKLHEVWEVRIRLRLAGRLRDLALFNLAIDSKLRGCDLVRVRLCDVSHAGAIAARAVVMQRKTQRPVQFELTEQTRDAVAAWVGAAGLRGDDYLFPGRPDRRSHLSARQYARLVAGWVAMIGLEPINDGTHSLRRTKATPIYRRTKNLRAVQLLLGHTKLESTVPYLGIEMEGALEIAEETEV